MRGLDELINSVDDAWPVIQGWVRDASSPVAILPADREAGEATLLALQVTTRSTMGAIALRAGAVLVDHGWLRILASGHPKVGGGLREWNESLGGEPLDPPLSRAMLVAYDAIGGFFALDGGAWSSEPGALFYLAPDTQAWGPMGFGYSTFVEWTMSDRLEQFYKNLRWPGWPDEVAALGPDQVVTVYPPLGFEPKHVGRTPIGDRSRRPVPAREQWAFINDMGRQVAGLTDGRSFRCASWIEVCGPSPNAHSIE